jgi:hypothetical protein
LLRLPLFALLYRPQTMDGDECGAVGGMLGRGNPSTGRKPVPIPPCPPQIPYDLTQARTRVAAAVSQRLTAQIMVRPISRPVGTGKF